MKPKLSEHETRLAQIKRALDGVADGSFSRLTTSDDVALQELIHSFNRMSLSIEQREVSLREQNVDLAAAVSRSEKLLDASIDGIALIDPACNFEIASRRFCEILGLSPGSLYKKTVEEGVALWTDNVCSPHRLLNVLQPNMADTESNGSDIMDDVIELTGSEPRYAQVYGAPILDDDGVYAGRIISLHENTREMELDRLKTEFISVVSHELRTPLTSIKGYTDLLISGATGEINEIQREFLGILQSSANRLGNLINDILDLSRIDAGRMEVKHVPVDYLRIVSDLLRLMKAAADEKEISVDVSFPQNLPMVLGDQDKISQVVSNLLSNAIKYTPEGGWIKVLIEVVGEATVRTCVADSGIGISSADQKQLFQKFFRADNSLTRQAGGTGLGLVIVKSIIEMLGGAVWVESEQGRGSRFYYTLPLSVEKLSELSVDPALSPAASNNIPDHGIALILVVANSPFIRETVQHALHRKGYGILLAASTDEAMQKARQHKPAIVLLDVMMDDCQGFDTLAKLNEDPATVGIPIITFTVGGDSSSGNLTFGSVTFINSPPNVPSLLNKMNEFQARFKPEPTALIVALDPETTSQSLRTAEEFIDRGVEATLSAGAAEAVSAIVERAPNVIVVDVNWTLEQQLRSFLIAIKSEVEFAQIPVVLSTNRFALDGFHVHFGASSSGAQTAVDYLCEQVALALRANSSRLSVDKGGVDGQLSGILSDNQ